MDANQNPPSEALMLEGIRATNRAVLRREWKWNGFCNNPRTPNMQTPHPHLGENGIWCQECGHPIECDVHDPTNIAAGKIINCALLD